ncbi:MAG: flavin oxidoreductase [Flavobacteriales bacterium]|nr:flavin oxidoreductase [Crocinitomicaceae bacterium]NBW30781.1 flavin oxidoreductase [Flavobacteriales bacterium]
MILTRDDIAQFEQLYRTAFVNSLAGFRQAVLVGTKSLDNNSNLAIFNSLIHLGANPALLGLINRPDSVQRDTLQNIIETKEYTLNYVRSKEYEKAHQTSARYDKGISEFEKVGFEELYHPFCFAPFVKDAVVSIAMKLEEIIPIKINGTVMIIGSIKQVLIAAEMIEKDGFVALSKEDVLISQGLDAYFVSKPIGRLPYAKP